MGYSDETLVDMYKNGDKDAIEELFERYKNLVRKKAKAMYLAGGDSDDLIQEGMIGLYKAVRDYTKEKGSFVCDICKHVHKPSDNDCSGSVKQK